MSTTAARRSITPRVLYDAPPGAPRVLGVCSATGGLGASTLAAVTATRAAHLGLRVCLVDLDELGGGLDVILGVEEEPGVRWGQLRGLDGGLDGPALLARLPRAGLVPVLAHDRSGGVGAPDEGAGTAATLSEVAAVCSALRDATDLVVLDVPRSPQLLHWAAHAADHLTVLCGGELRSLLALGQLLRGPLEPPRRGPGVGDDPGSAERGVVPARTVVVRGGRASTDVPAMVEDELGLAATLLADDASVPRDAQRGRPPGGGSRSPCRRVADWILAESGIDEARP